MAANIPNNPVAIQKFFTSRDNNANATTYVGQEQRLWYDPITNAIYVSDGNTAGGIAVGSSGSGNGVPGGLSTTVQYNNSGNFAGDPNFVFNSSTSTLNILNISVSGNILGGAGGSNTQVLFNDGGNISGNAQFTFNKATNRLTQTGSAFLGNVYAQANNISNLGNATNRFYDLWLGSGDINLIDDTLNINQQINAQNGNLVISGGNGLVFGQFAMYGNTIKTINATANINIGVVGDTGYVDIDRPLAVNSTGGGAPAFVVEQNGTVLVFASNVAANTSGALNIVGSLDRSYQNVTNSGGMLHITGADNTPARLTIDSFGVSGGVGAPVAIIGRVGRGNASTPSAVQANDTMVRVGAVGWATTGFTAPSPTATAIEFVALENFTDTAQGTKITFNTAATGANARSVSATIQANGVSFLNNTIVNSGITFRDGTFQNTAYSPTGVVQSLTAGAGISLSSTTGNITIASTGVLGVNGTTNQINVANVGNVLTLSLPQNFNTTANVQLYSLTVQDLVILGNVSNVVPSIVSGKIIYVANTANALNDINTSGLYSGNVANNYYAAILYNTTSNTWNMSIGNSVGITSANVYADDIIANNTAHLGNANAENYDFTNALLQGDVNIDSYGQFVLKNHSQTANASADIVAVANNGDDSSYYIDLGINSNVYANADYAVTVANDGYLYVNGGNLVIGTQTAAKVINFFTGGTSASSFIRGTINDTGLSMIGNVTANNMISTNATVGGTITATGNITGGNLLIPSGIISVSGNITGLNVNTGIVSATGNIVAGNIRTAGQVSATGNITAGNLLIPVGVANIGNITTGNIAAGNITSAIISATGNITGPNIEATLLTVSSLLSVSGNITGGNLLTDGIVSTTGNISAGYFLGNGSQLTGITLPRISNGTSNISIATASGNATVGISGTPNIAVFATTGEYVTGVISASSNVIGANLVGQNLTSGRVAIVGSGKEVSDDAEFTYNSSTNVLSVTGNINAAYFNGNGSLLTSITGANVTGTVANATYAVSAGSATTATTAATVTTNAQPNITSVGTLTSLTVSGNTSSGNILTAGLMSSTGNAIHGNVLTGGLISATGNVSGNYFIGNGSQLTGLNAYGNIYANGTAVLATTGSSTLTVTPGNNQVITGNNTSKVMTIAVNDNPTFNSVSVIGNITVSGNILTANTTYLANVGNILFSNVAPLPTAQPGVMEYDGRVLYFTPQDQERGVIPAQQWYVLNSARNLTFAATTPQSLFGVGAHVSNSTRYHFRIKATISRSSGTNNTALTLGWQGTATLARISYTVISSLGAVSTPAITYLYENTLVANFTNQLTVTSTNSPPDSADIVITGIIDVGASGVGYVDPYISWTGAAAAGSVTVAALSNFEIYPVGVTGANTSVGNWA